MIKLTLVMLLCSCLAGCAGTSAVVDEFRPEMPASGWTSASGLRWLNPGDTSPRPPEGPWLHYRLPGKSPTKFAYTRLEGHDAMAAVADASASMLRMRVNVPASRLRQVKFSWKTSNLMPQADMSQRDLDDSPVRVVLAFDGDRSTFSAKNAMLNELSRALTGEELPYAVIMYVWSKHKPLGMVIHSPRTDRIRKLVVETGDQRLSQWVHYERDVVADFQQLYGEAPGPLIGFGVMTDTDNTQTHAEAWYGPLQVVIE